MIVLQLAAVKQILEELPLEGGKALLDLYKQLPGPQRDGEQSVMNQLRSMLIRLNES